MPMTLNEWFCLKPDRNSFKPNVARDGALVFCHEAKIDDEIIISIERSFAAQRPVKMVIYGDWGVGKTHTIYHLSWWFQQHESDYPAKTILVELGDVTSRSRFNILVAPFLEKIGLRELVRLVHAYQPTTGTHIVEGLRGVGAQGNVADAFGKFLLASPGDTPPPAVATAFDFLKGGKPKDATSIGLSRPLTESEEFYSVLLCCGELYRAVEKQQLIFIADEAAKLDDVQDAAAHGHWVAVNRMIFEDTNTVFGFIYTLSGKGQRNVPSALSDAQIVNRLGENNMVELPNLIPTDVEGFLQKLRESFVQKPSVETMAASGVIDGSQYDWSAYPFTKDAWSEFIDYWSRKQEDAKPRDICDKLDDVGFRAIKASKRLIDADCLRKAKM